ncbi:short-chain dehydrogenase [Endozoicomonas montiporae]|uniref:Short-chain dehydrogenase n=3 Tax=Endozoicomonas montiporae TaxID=1027273 RepID=A0A081N931_9GAMM|nr:short-chain dehydrogenase/reductase SDR [Endozoicomonas montiporae CL-33]KEQ14954.1 short-chain dehydrogenase [Endozoicomonas montiporae]
MADNKVLVITGGSSGIGAETARHAVNVGWQVVIAGRRLEALQALSDELGGREKAYPVVCDVASWDDQQKLMQVAREHFGCIDAVFANAGIGGTPGGFSGADPLQWKDMLLTNVYGVGLTLRASLDDLRKNKGHVVLMSSAAGRLHLAGSMYGASKWAVTAIGHNLREELKGTGVRTTIIEPGVVDTPFFDESKPHGLKAEDIARSVVFALSQPDGVNLHEMTIYPTESAF